MKPAQHETIVIGLGAMGSAAAYHLAANGTSVLGIDRFHPPHQSGSSHGLTRIIREAYFEHPSYVPLVQRAYQLWARLEKESERQLLIQTGGLMIGPPDGALVNGARRSAEQHQLEHQILSATELRRRFSVFEPDEDTIAVWEPRAGILFPELAIQTHLELAAKFGATLKFNEPVLKWEPEGEGVRVFTETHTYTAPKLLLAPGAWMKSLLENDPLVASPSLTTLRQPDKNAKGKRESLHLPLSVERQVLYWFEPLREPQLFQKEKCPIYIWEYEPGRYFYGFPNLGDGVKVAIHHQGEQTDPNQIGREVSNEEIERMRSLLRQFVPAAAGPLNSVVVCMYTNTPDEHFVIDRHPAYPQVVIASPCSGHGFKFSSAIGELAAKLLAGGEPSFDLSRFRINRFNEREVH